MLSLVWAPIEQKCCCCFRGVVMRCDLCAVQFLPRTTQFRTLEQLGCRHIPASLQGVARDRHHKLNKNGAAPSGVVCSGTCAAKVRRAVQRERDVAAYPPREPRGPDAKVDTALASEFTHNSPSTNHGKLFVLRT